MRLPSVLRRTGPSVRSPDGAFDCAGYRCWEWDEDDLAAFAADPEYAVAVFFAEVVDAGCAGFEDP
jgi:hypothetical protein